MSRAHKWQQNILNKCWIFDNYIQITNILWDIVYTCVLRLNAEDTYSHRWPESVKIFKNLHAYSSRSFMKASKNMTDNGTLNIYYITFVARKMLCIRAYLRGTSWKCLCDWAKDQVKTKSQWSCDTTKATQPKIVYAIFYFTFKFEYFYWMASKDADRAANEYGENVSKLLNARTIKILWM